jgi:hypothetical protein
MLKWKLAERFGWTLAEVDALTVENMHEFIQIEDGRGKAREEMKPKPRAGKYG